MAKPQNWNEMTSEEQIILAHQLLFDRPAGLRFTTRAQYIIGQALFYGMRELKKAPPHRLERSNIEDMEILSLLFEPFVSMEELATGEWQGDQQ